MRFIQTLRYLSKHPIALAFLFAFLFASGIFITCIYALATVQSPETVHIKLSVPDDAQFVYDVQNDPISTALTPAEWKEQYDKHSLALPSLITVTSRLNRDMSGFSVTYWLARSNETYFIAREFFADPFVDVKSSLTDELHWKAVAQTEHNHGNVLILVPISNGMELTVAVLALLAFCLYVSVMIIRSLAEEVALHKSKEKTTTATVVTNEPIDETLILDDTEPGHLPHV